MFGFLKHYLIPHRGNNHRAKILHNTSLLLIILFFLSISVLASFVKHTNPSILGISYSISEGELTTLVNQQRQANSLPPLVVNAALSDAARRKASDMLAKNYWAHFSPDGSSSPWVFIKDSGYAYLYAGENLAKGFSDPGSVVNAWMNSPTHRENILSEKYQDVGFAIVPGTLQGEETVLVVQMFGARNQDTVANKVEVVETAVSISATPTVASAVPTPVVAQVAAANATSPTPEVSQTKVESKPAINANTTTKAVSAVGLSFLGFILIMDLVIVERKKIPRIVGHNLDHVMLIALFILFVVLISTGVIL